MLLKIISIELGVFVLLLIFILQRISFIIKIQTKMDQALSTYESFLVNIAGSFTAVTTALGVIAKALNPSGLTADDVTQLQTDLTNLAATGAAVAAAATTAAANAAAGSPAPAAPAAPATRA